MKIITHCLMSAVQKEQEMHIHKCIWEWLLHSATKDECSSCVCRGSRSEIWNEVWWLFDEEWLIGKSLIPKLLCIFVGPKMHWTKKGLTKRKEKIRVGHSWLHVCWHFDELWPRRKTRERRRLYKSCVRAHNSSTGQMSWSCFGVSTCRRSGTRTVLW